MAMKLRSRVLDFAGGLLLAICIGLGLLWARSHYRVDVLDWSNSSECLQLVSWRGAVLLWRSTDPRELIGEGMKQGQPLAYYSAPIEKSNDLLFPLVMTITFSSQHSSVQKIVEVYHGSGNTVGGGIAYEQVVVISDWFLGVLIAIVPVWILVLKLWRAFRDRRYKNCGFEICMGEQKRGRAKKGTPL